MRPITVSKETYYSVKRDLIQYKYFLLIEADSNASKKKRKQEKVCHKV
jgi:hypothetical protein